MKIIKHGKTFDTGRKFKGTCDYCGCVVECVKKEIKMTMDQRDGDYYWVKCPECSHHIYFNQKELQL